MMAQLLVGYARLRRFLICLLFAALLGSTVMAQQCTQQGGTLTVASGTQWLVLDPLGEYTSPEASVMAMVMERLIELTPEGEFRPLLASSWSVSDDGLAWTFGLREGITFHDGSPFNAEAVVANFARLKDESLGLPKQQLYVSFIEFNVIDDLTIEIVTSEPYGAMLAQLSHTSAFMISPKLLAEHPDKIGSLLVGTGPFRMDEWSSDEDVVLYRNADYWDGAPCLDRVVIKEVREPLTRAAMLETGEADIVFDLPPTSMPQFENRSDFVVRQDPSTRVMWLVLNNDIEPLNDLRVRRAIKHGIDVEAITTGLYRGAAQPIDNLVSPGVLGYTPDPDYHSYDPELARSLLAEAGYPNGFSITLLTPDGRYLLDRQSMLAIQDQLANVGIAVDVVPTEWAAFLRAIRAPREENAFQMYTWAWAGYTGDAEYNLRRLIWGESQPPISYTPFYSNPRVDELIASAITNTDQESRARMLEEALAISRDDHAYINLWNFNQTTVHNGSVHDITMYPEERFSFARAWLERGN